MASATAVDTNTISVRRAAWSDYEAVVNMMDVYEGCDYMPTFYHIFLQSKQHAVYVAERNVDQKLVGLANYRLGDDGISVFPLSTRVHPDFQGLGINKLMTRKFVQEFPSVKVFAFDGILNKGSARFVTRPRWTPIRHFDWNQLGFEIKNDSLQAWAAAATEADCSINQQRESEPTKLSPSTISDQLLVNIQQFLQQFSREYVPSAHPTWCPSPLSSPHTPALLKYQLLTTNVLVNYTSEHGIHADKPAGAGLISALSLQYPYLQKTPRYDGGVISYLFVYCNDINGALTNHVRAQLRHLANIVGNRDVYLALQFPMTKDADAVAKSFADNSWPTGMSTVVLSCQAYLASVDTRSRL